MTAHLEAKDIRGAKLAFGELCKDESNHEWLPVLCDCINFICEHNGSLTSLKESELAAAAMQAYDITEDEVVAKVSWVEKTLEDLLIGTVDQLTVAKLGKFFDAWADQRA